jgi:hypothetical protein
LTLNCPETPRPYPFEKRFGFATRKRQDHRHPKTAFYILRKVDDVNAEKVEACRSFREKDQSRRRRSLTPVAVFTSSEAPDFNRLSRRVQGEREDKTAPRSTLRCGAGMSGSCGRPKLGFRFRAMLRPNSRMSPPGMELQL